MLTWEKRTNIPNGERVQQKGVNAIGKWMGVSIKTGEKKAKRKNHLKGNDGRT